MACLAAGSLRVGAQAPSVPAGLTLESALALGTANNKTLVAERLRRAVDEASIEIARERPNPEISYEIEKEAPRHALSGAWPVETAGKRGRRIDLARAAAGTGAAGVERVVFEVLNAVRRAYFVVAAAEQRVLICAEVRDVARRARDAADVRVAAGDAPRLDLLQAELALADSDNDVTAAGGDLRAARAVLNGLIGQPVDTKIEALDGLEVGRRWAAADALAVATSASLDLKVIDRAIEEQAARQRLARAMQTPDVTAGGALVYDAPDEFRFGWRASFAVTVPVFARHRAAVVLEEAELARLRAERDALVSDIGSRVADAAARADATGAQAARYVRDILPQSLAIEGLAEESYRAGQTGLVVLLQALQSGRALRLRSVQAGLDAQLALADLERAMGAPIK